MCGILKSFGIDFPSNEYVQIIWEYFNSQHNSVYFDTNGLEDNSIHDTIELIMAVKELLLMHQQRLAMRQNLPDEYDFTIFNTDTMNNSYNDEMFYNFNSRQYLFFELINHWLQLKTLNPIEVMKEMAQHRD